MRTRSDFGGRRTSFSTAYASHSSLPSAEMVLADCQGSIGGGTVTIRVGQVSGLGNPYPDQVQLHRGKGSAAYFKIQVFIDEGAGRRFVGQSREYKWPKGAGSQPRGTRSPVDVGFELEVQTSAIESDVTLLPSTPAPPIRR